MCHDYWLQLYTGIEPQKQQRYPTLSSKRTAKSHIWQPQFMLQFGHTISLSVVASTWCSKPRGHTAQAAIQAIKIAFNTLRWLLDWNRTLKKNKPKHIQWKWQTSLLTNIMEHTGQHPSIFTQQARSRPNIGETQLTCLRAFIRLHNDALRLECRWGCKSFSRARCARLEYYGTTDAIRLRDTRLK